MSDKKNGIEAEVDRVIENILGDDDELHAEVVEFAKSAIRSILDTDRCFKDKNKSAGKRARKQLIEIKKSITPLRGKILEITSTKGEGEEENKDSE